jgi:hypothetical protein
MGWESWRLGRYSYYATEEYVSTPGRWKRIFCLVQTAHTGCESRSASFDSVGGISSWENGRSRKVITHFKLLQRLRISGEISPLHHTTSSMCAQGHIYLYFIVWLMYGWSFLQYAVPAFPSSTLLTKFEFCTCLKPCTACWVGNRIS